MFPIFDEGIFELDYGYGIKSSQLVNGSDSRTLRDENLYGDFPKIHVPTLIIHGIHDKVIPFAQAEELNQKIKNSKLVPFQYSGHGPFGMSGINLIGY